MFDPTYTEEQQALIATARKFTREVIIPAAHEYDEAEKFPIPVFNAAFELGLMNVELPEAYGGLGLHTLDGCLMAEELAYGCAAIATSIMCNHLAALPLLIAGSDAQKERYLGWLTREPVFASYACSEPEAGSDVAAMKTKLTRDGDGWRLSGQKRWITNANHAVFFTGFATVDAKLGHKGITGFVVEADRPGISLGKKEKKLGQRSSETSDVIFEDVKLTDADLLGEPGKGFYIAMETFDKSRPMIGAQCAGMIRRCLEESANYAKERRTFGKPIIDHQAVAFRLADLAARLEAARQLVLHAASLKDAGAPCLREASMAKLVSSETAEAVCSGALQTLGGYGYLEDYTIARIYRDVRVCQIYEGTSDIQRMVIARSL